MNAPQRHAFTLIELLIVVAIIAILAAIAVPNFLEAQTRSKVSRVKADMRTVATGLETYRVDYNHYPYGDGTGDGTAAGSGVNAKPGFWRITTPIAYLTSIPKDVFAPNEAPAVQPVGAYIAPYTPDFFYLSSKDGGFQALPNSASGYRFLVQDFRVNRLILLPNVNLVVAPGDTENVSWELKALGPDRQSNSSIPYDATNGTVSIGDVVLFGPGNSGLGF